jgi:ABC transporter substrate binding protein
MAYGVNFFASFRRAAAVVDKTLKGAKPGDIPIERATKFKFVLNLEAAKAAPLRHAAAVGDVRSLGAGRKTCALAEFHGHACSLDSGRTRYGAFRHGGARCGNRGQRTYGRVRCLRTTQSAHDVARASLPFPSQL